MATNVKVGIIHGSFGKPEGNWFPWLANELRSDGHEVIVPRFPTPDGQSLDSWCSVFAHEFGALTRGTVLVGHSLGPGLILNILEQSKINILGTFLISGFLGKLGLPDFDHVNESFVCRSFDWSAIRRNAGFIKIYNSDDDPYVPLQKGQELAEKLGVPLNVVKAAGHINADSGFTKFPLLLQDVRNLLKESIPAQ